MPLTASEQLLAFETALSKAERSNQRADNPLADNLLIVCRGLVDILHAQQFEAGGPWLESKSYDDDVRPFLKFGKE